MIQFCAVLSLFLATSASVADTREAVVAKYVAALGEYKFEEAARLVRGSDLADYKSSISTLLRAEAQAGKADFRSMAFGDGASLDDALNASPEAVFASTLKVMMGVGAQLNMTPEFLPPKVLGEIPENPELVHLLVRSFVRIDGSTISRMEVISMAPDGAEWKIILADQVKAMGPMMLKQFQRRQQQ